MYFNLNRFREAAIQNGVISNIRSDHILWINEELTIAQQHIDALKQLSQILNYSFYLGIQDVEAHLPAITQVNSMHFIAIILKVKMAV